VRLHSFFYHSPEEAELDDADEQEHTISVYCCDENDAPEYGISERMTAQGAWANESRCFIAVFRYLQPLAASFQSIQRETGEMGNSSEAKY
jgi:hypothetical protein